MPALRKGNLDAMTTGAIRKHGSMDVVQAARIRITNMFSHGMPIYFGFSGGKDSLVLGHLVLELIKQRKIDPALLVVIFVDEEAIFDDVDRIVREWRIKFMMEGAAFRWYCLEVKHFNCFNNLESDESFICWDRNKKESWVREPPDFAIKSHPMLKIRKDNYQAFFPKITRDGIQMLGVRIAESIQRTNYFSSYMKKHGGRDPSQTTNIMLPIYDFSDNDVWLYLKNNKVEIPIEYIYMWQTGASKKQLRISQFFSIDTAGFLVSMGEFCPDLMSKVVRREPNAYLASLYWDSEMFRRSTSTRRALEKDETKDYKQIVLAKLAHPDRHFNSPSQRALAKSMMSRVSQFSIMMTDRDWKRAHAILEAGDPKSRSLRALMVDIQSDYALRIGATKKGVKK